MKTTVSILLMLLISSCALNEIRGFAKKEQINGVIMYEFVKNGNYYCESNCYLYIGKKHFYFFDYRSINSSILFDNQQLQRFVGSDTLYDHFFFEPDSIINLNYCSYKRKSSNVDGVININSPVIYSMKKTENLFIAFSIKAEVIHYKNVEYFRNNKSERTDDCCNKFNKDVKSDFLVMTKLVSLKKLSKKQESKFEILKTDTQVLSIFVCE